MIGQISDAAAAKVLSGVIGMALGAGITFGGMRVELAGKANNERVSVNETNISAVQEDITEIKNGMVRMEAKLDRLIERDRPTAP